MVVFLDRKARVVAVFRHYCDSVQYRQDNVRHGYRELDIPTLSELIEHLVGEAIGGLHSDGPGGRISGE